MERKCTICLIMCQVRIIKKKTNNYSVTDEITNDRTKVVGTRKSERNVAKSSNAEKMKKHREIRKLFKISEYKEYLEKERISGVKRIEN